MKSCFFIGHRDADEQVLSTITEITEALIQREQVGDFYVGNHGKFDRIAAEAVIQLKKQYPHIRLFQVLAYHPADRPITLQNGCDSTYYPDGMEYVPRRYAIARANRIMIEKADYLIAYVWHTASNASKLLAYARRQEQKGNIHVINAAEQRDNRTRI